MRSSSAVSLALVALLWGCSAAPAPCPTSAAAAASRGGDDPADVLALHEIEVVFHDAGGKKELDRMMSLFTDDAVLSVGGKTYTGKDEVRHYFADVAAPFRPENNFIAYTPAQRIRTTIHGDEATLYFECLWLDTAKQQIAAHTFSDDTVVRRGGKWLVKTMKAGPVPGL
jgi:ketosteroid isomerase-like protein